MGRKSWQTQGGSLDEESFYRSPLDWEDNHDSAVLYCVAAEGFVVSRLAAVEDKDGGRNSTAVGGMEDLAAVVMARSLSVGCKGVVHNLPAAADAVEADFAAVVAALEKGVVFVEVLVLGEAEVYR